MSMTANAGVALDQRQQSESHPGMNRVLFLLTLSVLINYVDRSNLSIAAPLIKDELSISASQLGTMLSAFFWSYALMQIPAGWLVDRFDVKWVFAAGFSLWTVATGVTALLHGFIALLIIRIILGVGESVAFPSYSKVLGSHFKEANRGFANAMIITGLALGPAFGILIGGEAVSRFGWRSFFVGLAFVGLLWLPFWIFSMPARQRQEVATSTNKAGFLQIFRHRSAWGTCIGQSAINYFLYFLVTWLPFYLVRGRHMSLTQMARAGALVFLISAISSAVTGKLSDIWIRDGASVSSVRKGCMLVGHIGIGIMLCLTVISHGWIFYLMLALTGVFLGMSMCNSWAIPQILAGPSMVGRWAGTQNFIGNLAGAVAPALTGFLLDRTGSFYWPFFITALVAWIGAIGWYFVVGPLEEVQWDAVART
ncbi:MAG TPA: MFS transporter [Terriglobales bacterium]|nr:MFS transporter [Terriglobales bacterium]